MLLCRLSRIKGPKRCRSRLEADRAQGPVLLTNVLLEFSDGLQMNEVTNHKLYIITFAQRCSAQKLTLSFAFIGHPLMLLH